MDMTLEEFAELQRLVRKLDRNRHFIGDGVSVGIKAMEFANFLSENTKVIENAIGSCYEPDEYRGPVEM